MTKLPYDISQVVKMFAAQILASKMAPRTVKVLECYLCSHVCLKITVICCLVYLLIVYVLSFSMNYIKQHTYDRCELLYLNYFNYTFEILF